MRRAVLWVMALVVPAHAGPWVVTAETGAELDTNVERVETGPGLDNSPITSPVLRFGAKLEGRGTVLGGGYALVISDLTRIVGDPEASVENVTLLAGDLRWLHPIGDRKVSAGFAVLAARALPLSDPIGARTFANLGADALVVARGAGDRRLTLAVGARAFTYYPDETFDWIGPTASARLDLGLWRDDERAKSLELATTFGFEAREYGSYAYANGCPPALPPNCFAPTSLSRRDRFARVGAELTWVGAWVWAIGYQLTVIDSNSYGQSLVRHRASASATVELGWRVYGTLLAILQVDRYRDGILVASDPNHVDFANIEDENRSSLQLHLARKVSRSWSLELRAAAWRNIATTMNLAFERELVYFGAVYSR